MPSGEEDMYSVLASSFSSNVYYPSSSLLRRIYGSTRINYYAFLVSNMMLFLVDIGIV